jgi:hypothetical protein
VGAYWHLLSLDAPSVAALWAWMLARVAGVSLPVHAPLLLALGTWLLYVGDRILDGLRCPDLRGLQARHRFYARHRIAFVLACTLGTAVLVWFILHSMPARTRRDNLVLAAAGIVYFTVVHFPSNSLRRASRLFPKEFAVGLIFAAATAVPTWSRSPQSVGSLLLVGILLASLAWMNCVAIETWERSGAALSAAMHPSTRFLGDHFTAGAGALALSSLLAATACLAAGRTTAAGACASVSLSASLLLLLHGTRHALGPLSLRVFADAALLTPLLVFAFLN